MYYIKIYLKLNIYILYIIFQTDVAGTYNVELTDGWYSVQGLVDHEMNMLLHKGIVKVGTKLMTYNAELIGAGEGIDPLDVNITHLNLNIYP